MMIIKKIFLAILIPVLLFPSKKTAENSLNNCLSKIKEWEAKESSCPQYFLPEKWKNVLKISNDAQNFFKDKEYKLAEEKADECWKVAGEVGLEAEDKAVGEINSAYQEIQGMFTKCREFFDPIRFPEEKKYLEKISGLENSFENILPLLKEEKICTAYLKFNEVKKELQSFCKEPEDVCTNYISQGNINLEMGNQRSAIENFCKVLETTCRKPKNNIEARERLAKIQEKIASDINLLEDKYKNCKDWEKTAEKLENFSNVFSSCKGMEEYSKALKMQVQIILSKPNYCGCKRERIENLIGGLSKVSEKCDFEEVKNLREQIFALFPECEEESVEGWKRKIEENLSKNILRCGEEVICKNLSSLRDERKFFEAKDFIDKVPQEARNLSCLKIEEKRLYEEWAVFLYQEEKPCEAEEKAKMVSSDFLGFFRAECYFRKNPCDSLNFYESSRNLKLPASYKEVAEKRIEWIIKECVRCQESLSLWAEALAKSPYYNISIFRNCVGKEELLILGKVLTEMAPIISSKNYNIPFLSKDISQILVFDGNNLLFETGEKIKVSPRSEKLYANIKENLFQVRNGNIASIILTSQNTGGINFDSFLKELSNPLIEKDLFSLEVYFRLEFLEAIGRVLAHFIANNLFLIPNIDKQKEFLNRITDIIGGDDRFIVIMDRGGGVVSSKGLEIKGGKLTDAMSLKALASSVPIRQYLGEKGEKNFVEIAVPIVSEKGTNYGVLRVGLGFKSIGKEKLSSKLFLLNSPY